MLDPLNYKIFRKKIFYKTSFASIMPSKCWIIITEYIRNMKKIVSSSCLNIIIYLASRYPQENRISSRATNIINQRSYLWHLNKCLSLYTQGQYRWSADISYLSHWCIFVIITLLPCHWFTGYKLLTVSRLSLVTKYETRGLWIFRGFPHGTNSGLFIDVIYGACEHS